MTLARTSRSRRVILLRGPSLPAATLTAALLAAGPAVAANLILNSGFEDAAGDGVIAEGWSVPETPAGGRNCVTDAVAHSGRFSHTLVVPEASPVTWYQVRQNVPGLRPGTTVTLSVYVRTEKVRDGAGAYCSLNCFAADGQRIGIFDAADKLQGTSDGWVRQFVTATVPPGSVESVVILTLHGHGAAWFDDVQLEEGAQPTAYRLSAADEEAARLAEAQRAEAERLAPSLGLRPGARGHVAILRDDLPPDGCASDPVRLGSWLQDAGYGVAYLNAAQLSNPFVLRGPLGQAASDLAPPFDLLVLPYGGAFPASAARALKSYLRQGGAFLSTGGYAFDTQLVRYQDRWFRPEDLPRPDGPSVTVLDFDDPGAPGSNLAAWYTGSDSGAPKPVLRLVPGREGAGRALEFSVSPMGMWATASVDLSGHLPAPEATGGQQWTVTRFWARGDADTPKLALEWDEADGSRWEAHVPLTTEWKEYVVTAAQLKYWPDNPSVGRGGVGDRFHPERAQRLLVGLDMEIAARARPHSFQIDDLRVQADPLAELREAAQCLNTRFATIRDAMWPRPDQIPVFDPSHPLRWVRAARPAPGQFVVTDGVWDGPLDGWAAVAMLSNQGHGFGPNLWRLVPLLEATDRFGRNRGAAGAILYGYDGYYRGAAAAFFGVTNRDLFGPDCRGAQALLCNTVDALLRRVYLHETDTEFSSYRPGETVRFRTRVANHGREDRHVQVCLEAFAESPGEDGPAEPAFAATRDLALMSGATQELCFEWRPPQDSAASLYRFHATALVDGRPVDREENAVVIWRDNPPSALPPLTRQGPYFALGDRTAFLMGCQSYWGQNGSVTARSPLALKRDFAMMQDYGLNFSRLFVPFRTEADRRQSDAMVQLAQQHHIVFYHTPNLSNTVAPGALAEQRAISRAIGERYARTPWLVVDVCNEPSVPTSADWLVAPFNDYLREQYGTTEALQAAWGADDTVALGTVKPQALSDRWDDMRSHDTHRFLALVQQRWADANRAAVREGDPGRMVSVGQLQGFGSNAVIWDPRTCHANLDFTDRHYYGDPSGQPCQLKDIDQRLLGKPLVQGECGAKNHPTYAAADPWGMGDDDERYHWRFLFLVHHAFGVGASALASWHWRDPMEGIFPCGLVHADGVPRPAASVMRAMALTFCRLRPRYEPPQVVLVIPDCHRFGGARTAVNEALHRAQKLLFACQVDFGVLGEDQLAWLPEQTRALIYPLPYCPPDEVVASLRAFVERGGALYFSGDMSYDPKRRLTRTMRLVDLAGVERTGEYGPHLDRNRAAVQLAWTDAAGEGLAILSNCEARPAIGLRLIDAVTLAAGPDGQPVVTLARRGAGQVLFCADPLEAAEQQAPWHRALYADFLRRAGVARNPVTPDTPSLRCFRVPLEGGGDVFVLYNDHETPVDAALTLPRATYRLTLAGRGPGLVVIDANGRLLAVEAQGEVYRDGSRLAAIRGHAIVQSLDGEDLATSRCLLLLPLPGHGSVPPVEGTPARVALPRLAQMRCELGEVRGSKWRCLEPLTPQEDGSLVYDCEQALNMILVEN